MAEEPLPPTEQPVINPDEVAQAASLENQVSEPTPIEVKTDDPSQATESDDTRWDHDKAETAATALKEDEQFGSELDKHTQLREDVESGKYEDRDPNVIEAQRNTDGYKEDLAKIEEAAANPNLDNDKKKDVEEYLESSRRALPAYERGLKSVKEAARARGEKEVKQSREAITELSDNKLTPYEELYDLNPEAFANMPTSEFMDVAREFSAANSRLDLWNAELKQTPADDIAKAIEEKRPMTLDEVRRDFETIHRTLAHKAENARVDDDKLEEVQAIFKEAFDKTPREIMNKVKALADQYTARMQEERDVAQAKRDEIINKYTPKSDHEES